MTKISLKASRIHFSEKAQMLFASPLFKKFMMLLCFLGLLAIAIVTIFHLQPNTVQANAVQDTEQELHYRSNLDGTLADIKVDETDAQIEAGRSLMLEVEELAGSDMARILEMHFGSESKVEGSVHYDLLDIDDYSNPLLSNWTVTNGISALIQSADFPVETTITLRFADDRQVDNFDLQEIQSLFDKICQQDIIKTGQKASILLKGSESARLFYCPQAGRDGSKLEELVLN